MTKKQLSQLDPDSRRPLLWIRRLAIGLVGAVLFLAAVVAIVAKRGEDTRSIVTRISECEHDAESAACQEIRQEGAEAQSVATACITIRQGGYPCPRPGSKAARRQVELHTTTSIPATEAAEPAPDPGSDQPQPGSPPPTQPANPMGHGHGHESPDEIPTEPTPATGETGSAPASGADNLTAGEEPDRVLAPTIEALETTVQKAGAVGKTVLCSQAALELVCTVIAPAG